MRLNSINMNVVQMAAGKWQLANGNCHQATAQWLLTTGCLQTSAGRKLLVSKPGRRQKVKGIHARRK
jgi:hypothetical protein